MDDGDRADGSRRWGRLRWRLRGAWLWPTFAAATVLEMFLLHWLPVQGDATGWVAALLVAGCLNLIGVVVVGGLGGVLLHRRRADMPKVVADNYAGMAALALVAAGFVVAGVAHRPSIVAGREAFTRQSQAVRLWVERNGDAYARAHVESADSVLVDVDLYRTCVPTPDPKRWLCLIVNTTVSPPSVRRDTSREPNATFNPRGGFR